MPASDASESDPHERLRDDPALASLVDEYGALTLDPADDPFRRLVQSIVSQQVSTASAAAIRERLYDRFEVTPEAMADADPDALREVGLSNQKAEYVRHVADAFLEGDYSVAAFDGVDDDAVIDELTDIHGVGVWTAKMYLMFGLGREDVFPVEDLGIRNGMERVHGAELTRAEMVERAATWRPYRSYASLYLWRAVD
jgi:DNA-3-methyladenine glycosylase II